mmetsp:Transcript_24406/g.68000  ORF Transcript_24406/g.68000 Transcript_24406/m.68000 type:complete len:498 (-) Transcript_24406:232-1725(-)|eukprot:CAMPEP_0198131798 /NCGR_PEP_ID=MMETSP1442-20131203/56946_1 /TAXON_ID= /ORGANISM="Craspedostauros australis, Strain CCMP3328" /LENGTH=497 /DNA_ID=CAMNT_0043792671 /DNA_START=42 /DNA_END=1535 /DNA_ORIENTATION=+
MRDIHVGTPRIFAPEESFCIHFHRFSSLKHYPGDVTTSPSFECNGFRWCIRIYPGGNEGWAASRGYVSLCLKLVSVCDGNPQASRLNNAAAEIAAARRVRGASAPFEVVGVDDEDSSNERNHQSDIMVNFSVRLDGLSIGWSAKTLFGVGRSWGWSEVCQRQTILDHCAHATNDRITINLTMQVEVPELGVAAVANNIDLSRTTMFHAHQPWIPKRPTLQDDMKRLFASAARADVNFLVGQEQISIMAHKNILHMRIPVLSGYLRDIDGEYDDEATPGATSVGPGITTVPLLDVDPANFKRLLLYAYTDSTKFSNDEDDGANGSDGELDPDVRTQEMLKIANQFGCWQLKVKMEAEIIQHQLDDATALHLLLLAEANCCAMLKEAALDVIVGNLRLHRAHDDWTNVAESATLMEAIAAKLAGVAMDGVDDGYSHMSSALLYAELEERGEEIASDGTRQMLLGRLRSLDAAADGEPDQPDGSNQADEEDDEAISDFVF